MMQEYSVYKFDSESVILKESRAYRVVSKGSDKSLFWVPQRNAWCESTFTADQLARLATFVGTYSMQLK